jgi:hypothetical protein
MGSNRKGRDIDSALCKKGFSRKKSGDHVRYAFAGMPYIRTMMSHGMMGDSIGIDLISRMSRQLHFSPFFSKIPNFGKISPYKRLLLIVLTLTAGWTKPNFSR